MADLMDDEKGQTGPASKTVDVSMLLKDLLKKDLEIGAEEEYSIKEDVRKISSLIDSLSLIMKVISNDAELELLRSDSGRERWLQNLVGAFEKSRREVARIIRRADTNDSSLYTSFLVDKLLKEFSQFIKTRIKNREAQS